MDHQTPQTFAEHFKELGFYLSEGCLAPLVFTTTSLGSIVYSWYSFLVEGSLTGFILGKLGLIGSIVAAYVTNKAFYNYHYYDRTVEKRAHEATWRDIRDPFWRQIIRIEPHPVDKLQK